MIYNPVEDSESTLNTEGMLMLISKSSDFRKTFQVNVVQVTGSYFTTGNLTEAVSSASRLNLMTPTLSL